MRECFILCFIIILDAIGICSAIHTRGSGLLRVPRRLLSSVTSAGIRAPPTGQQVRLTRGTRSGVTNGRVEVFARDKFGAVCDTAWDVRDADVVCRQMGFLRGAISASKGKALGDGNRYVMDSVACDEHSRNIMECDSKIPHNCGPRNAAGVVCRPNTGCPERWIAGPTGCYSLLTHTVTERERAINKCLSRGGHLITIETEAENHFISHVFWGETNGLILTGGVKIGGVWMWEKVTKKTDGRYGQTTTQVSIEDFKWFPGFQPGNVSSQPTDQKKDRCLFLSNVFQHSNGSDVNVDYHFWQNDQCTRTRKRSSSGVHYICERPLDRTEDVGCFRGIGTEYRGTASYTNKGTPCMKWTEANDINPEKYPTSGLGNHNYCRNPDNDESPWCWISDRNFEFCDIPECTDADDNRSEESQQEIACHDDEYTCNDDSCIPSHWKCDMEADCVTADDEDQSCDYNLPLFKHSKGFTVRGYEVETYAGATNETCATYCRESKRFVCRAFSFSARTRECLLSRNNSETANLKQSRREDLFEILSQLDGCEEMFQCGNGRCLAQHFVCDGIDQCKDFSDESECGEDVPISVRLMGGTDRTGRVEVLYRGEWGVICDDRWDDADATVICTMLGYTGKSNAIRKSYYGSGHGDILLDEVACTGTETSIDQCEHNNWKDHDCSSWEVASVQCSDKEVNKCNVDNEFLCTDDSSCVSLNVVCDENCQCPGCTDEQTCDSKIRLVNGDVPNEGRVEIELNGVTGSICDDYFGDEDANVVCRMLGYSWGTSVKDVLLNFGPGSGIIWMDDVACIGNETDIIECSHVGPPDHNCGHDEDVGVICQTAADAITVELEGADEHTGRVILTRNGDKGTICDDNWDDQDATVICRMLGFRNGKGLSGEFYGPGDVDMQIFLDDVKCTGAEESIELCPHSDWLINNCDHSEDAAVTCEHPVNHRSTTTAARTTLSTTIQSTIQSTTQPSTPIETASPDCKQRDASYTGKIAETENGFECQSWNLNTPHEHKHHNDSSYPDGSVTAARNYCRNPDDDPLPWCYTLHRDERWGYCNIPTCKDNCYTIASEYTGPTSHSTSDYACQRWSSDSPHHHKYHTDTLFPDTSADAAANRCRSPDGDVTPWCYTTNSDVRWQYCDVPRCAEGEFNPNMTCGLRPLENNRRRRDAGLDDDSYELDDDSYELDDDSLDLNFHLYRKMGRIFGGSKASYGMYPWQVGVRRRMSGSLSYHLHHCGGTIIGEYWVLSAAHCFRDVSKGQVVVRTGDLNTGHRDKFEQEFDVDEIIAHNLYSDQDYDYDIALLRVRPIHGRGIVFNDYVQPACLPNETTQYRPGYKCLISGWGAHEEDIESVHMRAARIPIVDHRTCNRLYKQTISSNMICAGYLAGGIDTCSGDSGGPLVCKIKEKYTVMGVVSFGEGCAMPNAPGVYARVSAFIPWIKKTIGLDG